MSMNVILFVVKTAQNAHSKRRQNKANLFDHRLALEKKEKTIRDIQNLAARRQLF
ncbi:MAG: hypothetical protein ACOYI3_04995 [Christensenellales bacterium]|jgi:hypothetical protein